MTEGIKLPYNSLKEKQRFDKDVRSLILLSNFTDRLRYKGEGEGERRREDYEFTNGDKGFLSLALFDYLGNYEKDLGTKEAKFMFTQILFSCDIADSAELAGIPEYNMSGKEQADELNIVINYLSQLPDMGEFRDMIWTRYLKYKASLYAKDTTPENILSTKDIRMSRLAKACKGVASLMYIAHKDPAVREKILEGSQLDKEAFEAKYLRYIVENRTLLEVYKRLCGIVFKKIARAEYTPIKNRKKGTPVASSEPENTQLARHLLETFLPNQSYEGYLDVFSIKAPQDAKFRNEVISFFKLLNIKANFRFGLTFKNQNEHRDSVPEHTYFMMILALYFLPLVNKGGNIDFRDVFNKLLYHDMGESLTGDVVTFQKTETHSQEEADSAKALLENFFPRKKKMNERIYEDLEEYEREKKGRENPFTASTFIKALDILEAFIYIFDPRTSSKQTRMTIVSPTDFKEKNRAIFDAYPILNSFLEEIIKLRGLSSAK